MTNCESPINHAVDVLSKKRILVKALAISMVLCAFVVAAYGVHYLKKTFQTNEFYDVAR